jgi:hypothetical protein
MHLDPATAWPDPKTFEIRGLEKLPFNLGSDGNVKLIERATFVIKAASHSSCCG